MSWTIWLIGSAALFLPGAILMRAGKLKVVRLYLGVCAALLLIWVFGLGALAGPAYADWPRMLLSMLVPGTLVLLLWGTQRDRKRVMGSQAERDALATGAFIYGASHTHDSGAGGDMGDTGGGGF